MKILHPSKEYIPLLLCEDEVESINLDNIIVPNYKADYLNKNDVFANVENNITEFKKINTPFSSNYLYNRYLLMDAINSTILVLACKLSDSKERVTYTIPDKSQWVIFRNCEDSSISHKFIKNVLEINGRKQIKWVTSNQINDLFAGFDNVNMQLLNPVLQQEISANFLNLHRE